MHNNFIKNDGVSVVDVNTKGNRDLEEITPITYKLNSGITLSFTNHLDCGGTSGYEEFGNLVSKYKTKNKYNRCFEWCAGLGAFGFHMYGLDLCETIVFNDYYEFATSMCKKTALDNNIADKVTVYTTANISNIPTTEKYDLVIGNPPHVWEPILFENDNSPDEKDKMNLTRCLVDYNMETHNKFFTHIRDYITDDADLFIVENDHRYVEDWAKLAKLVVVNKIKMYSELWHLIHYKPK